MRYSRHITLPDGEDCLVRSLTGADAEAACAQFCLTHGQTDFLLSYPDENSYTAEQEHTFLLEKEMSPCDVELGAFIAGHLAGTAGIERVCAKDKAKHRAEFGISVDRAYWRRGVGRALTLACIACAREAGYLQLELKAVRDNAAALALYHSVGFIPFGENPLGFRTREGVFQPVVLMRLDLRLQ